MHDTDQLTQQLAELRDDLRGAPVADAAAVRKRGDRRRRNSRLAKSGVALAAVAAVGLVPSAGGFPDLDRPGGSTARSGTVSLPAGTDAGGGWIFTSLSTDVLLPPWSIAIGSGTEFRSLGATPPRSAVQQRVTECVVRTKSAPAQERWYAGEGTADEGAAAYQAVILLPNAAAAEREAQLISASTQRCGEPAALDDVPTGVLGVSEDRDGRRLMHVAWLRDSDGKPIFQAIGVLQRRNVVTYVVVQTTSKNPSVVETMETAKARIVALLQDAGTRLGNSTISAETGAQPGD